MAIIKAIIAETEGRVPKNIRMKKLQHNHSRIDLIMVQNLVKAIFISTSHIL